MKRELIGVLVGFGYVVGAMASAGTREDPLVARLRAMTDTMSWAGQKGDQATVDGFLDDEILFSAGDGNVQRDEKLDKSDALSQLLRQQTQAFQAASQRGDIAAMRRYLDRKILYVNEDGVVSDWSDFGGGAPAAVPGGLRSSVSITDWVVHHTGHVAAASFVVHQTASIGGQTLQDKYLAVETWIEHDKSWKLIGSETIPLHEDPVLLRLPESRLNDYAGTYTAGPGSERKISVSDDALAISSNGAKPVSFKAEAPDVFLLPGQPAGYARQRCVFQRDAAGLVTGYTTAGILYEKSTRPEVAASAANLTTPEMGQLVLRDFVVHFDGDVAIATFLHDRVTPWYGQTLRQTYRSMETWIRRSDSWKILTSQGRQILPDDRVITLPADTLNDYAGTYAAGGALHITIAREGAFLIASTQGEGARPLDAAARDVFFTPGAPRVRILFQRDADGHISGFIHRREERDLLFARQ